VIKSSLSGTIYRKFLRKHLLLLTKSRSRDMVPQSILIPIDPSDFLPRALNTFETHSRIVKRGAFHRGIVLSFQIVLVFSLHFLLGHFKHLFEDFAFLGKPAVLLIGRVVHRT